MDFIGYKEEPIYNSDGSFTGDYQLAMEFEENNTDKETENE